MREFGTRDPVAYIVAFEKNERVTYHGSSTFDEQAAVRYYLSPFDAVLDIYRNADEFAKVGSSISVRPVDAFTPAVMTTPAYQSVIGCVHLAWRACSGKVLIRPDGSPVAVLSTAPELESGNPLQELPAALARVVDEVHERAGLYAWRETARTFDRWRRYELSALAEQAWRSVQVVESDGSDPDFEQLAIYDPEFRQWHFVCD